MIDWRNLVSLGLLAVTECSTVVDTHGMAAGGSGGGSTSCSLKTDGELVARWTGTLHADHQSKGPQDPRGYGEITSVTTDPQGNAFVAGIYWGAGEFAGVALPETEELDSFLAKLDQNGKLLWLKPIAGKGYEC